VSWSDASVGVHAYRTGRVIVVTVNPNGATSIDGHGRSTLLTTLPQEYRPKVTHVAACEAGGKAVQIMVFTDGSVKIYNGGIDAGSYWLRGSITYIYDL
jgi:hypothetical protein